MSDSILKVSDLHVSVADKEILKGVNLSINKGETHVLMGPNGTGKSTLGYALIGNPKYEISKGSIVFDGKDITEDAPDERAKAGIFFTLSRGGHDVYSARTISFCSFLMMRFSSREI